MRVIRNVRLLLTVAAMTLVGCAGMMDAPMILSGYGSPFGPRGGYRPGGAHSGVDLGEHYGAPVIAAADGLVLSVVEEGRNACGNGVLLDHKMGSERYFTVYCHLASSSVKAGQTVRRSEEIGRIGTSGNSGGIPHVHWELCRYPCPNGHAAGAPGTTQDPIKLTMGCFDPAHAYPTDRLVLTYPVRCGKAMRAGTKTQLRTDSPR